MYTHRLVESEDLEILKSDEFLVEGNSGSGYELKEFSSELQNLDMELEEFDEPEFFWLSLKWVSSTVFSVFLVMASLYFLIKIREYRKL